ncbi:unnamed protein product [Diamesa serratosioi]
MTILTKTGDKKPEKKLLPVPELLLPSAPVTSNRIRRGDVEEHYLLMQQNRFRSTTILLVLTGILVLSLGILAGLVFYRQYAIDRINTRIRMQQSQMQCYIPYDNDDLDPNAVSFMNDKLRSPEDTQFDELTNNPFFASMLAQLQKQAENSEQLHDTISERMRMSQYEDRITEMIRPKVFLEKLSMIDGDLVKLDVPDFKDGRSGSFVHDFRHNESVIIDADGKRCLVYPLDREVVMPPTDLLDAFVKMSMNAYLPNMEILQKKMRIVGPEMDFAEISEISPRIAKYCKDNKIYRMEPYVSGVYKRSVPVQNESGKFAEMTGKDIVEYDIVNIEEILTSEKKAN